MSYVQIQFLKRFRLQFLVSRGFFCVGFPLGIPRKATSLQEHRLQALAKLANIAWQTLLFVSESVAKDKKVTSNFKMETIVLRKQCWPVSPGLKR